MASTRTKERGDTLEVDRGRRLPGWLLVLGGLILAALLVGGGVLLANWLGSSDDLTPEQRTADSVTLQGLALNAAQADQVISQLQTVEPTDTASVQSLAIQLQSAAMAIDEVAQRAMDPALKDLANDMSEAYLDLGVGIATNSEARTQQGVEKINTAQASFNEYLGVEEPAPTPAPSPEPSASPTP